LLSFREPSIHGGMISAMEDDDAFQKVLRLVDEYFAMEHGALIEKHKECLPIFVVTDSVHPMHPHDTVCICISRMALKHIVESRKKELAKRHSDEESLDIIRFALLHVGETIVNFDRYEFEPPTHYYVKDFSHEGKPPLRVALDLNGDSLEIKSVHFQKRK
jgi:hypothetical protein